jgi:hypothetical protein
MPSTRANVTASFGSTPSANNPVINGGFDIWQRGTSFAMSSAGYSADRWYQSARSGETISRQTTSDSTNLPFIQYCARVARDSGNTSTDAIRIVTLFESVNSIPFAGKTVTLSFYARRGANFSSASNVLTAQLATGTGTDQNLLAGGYTGTAYPIGDNVTLTTTWQRFTLTGTVASTATELTLLFYFVPVGTAGAADYFEITGVQLDVGSVALPFRRTGGTIQGELAACQRYYQKSYEQGTAPATNTTNGAIDYAVGTATTSPLGIPIIFPVTMRIAPTVTPYDNVGNSGKVYRGGTNKTASFVYISNNGASLYCSDATSSAELIFHYVASAEL